MLILLIFNGIYPFAQTLLLRKVKKDNYLQLLEESEVGKIIEESLEKYLGNDGRPSYNPYHCMLYERVH